MLKDIVGKGAVFYSFRILILEFPKSCVNDLYIGFCSLLRYLLGITEEERQIRREEILSTRYNPKYFLNYICILFRIIGDNNYPFYFF